MVFIIPQIIFAGENDGVNFLDGSKVEIFEQYEKFANKTGYNEDVSDPEELIASIIQYLFTFLGVIFIVLIIYAGFLWMTAQGEEEQITKAKDIMKSSIIGLIIVLMSSVITYSILPIFLGAAPAG